jgi:hypothetical protein
VSPSRLRLAVGRLREYTEGTVAGFDPGPDQTHAKEIVAQGMAEAASASDYANAVRGGSTGPAPVQVHEGIETALEHAAEAYFYLGQVIATPSRAVSARHARGGRT